MIQNYNTFIDQIHLDSKRQNSQSNLQYIDSLYINNQITSHSMKLNIQDIQTSTTDVRIVEMAKMILAGFLLILALVYLWSNKKTKPIRKVQKNSSQINRAQRQDKQLRMPDRINPISSTQTFKFSIDEDYEICSQSQNNDSFAQQKQLISLLREDRPIKYDHVCSMKQARQNFLSLLKQSPKESIIYLDESDIKERQDRKLKLQENQQIKINRRKKEYEEQKLKQKNKEEEKQKQSKDRKESKKDDKVQGNKKEEGKPTIGQRSIFSVNKDKPKAKEPSKPLNFANVSLGMPKKQQSQKTQSQQPNITILPPKEETKPVEPSQGNFSGLLNQPQQQTLFGVNQQQPQQPSLFAQKPVEQQLEQKRESVTNPVQPILPQAPSKGTTSSSLPQQPSPAPPGPVVPPVQQPSYQPSQPVLPRPSTFSKPDYLQKLIDYANRAKEHSELKKTKINNFGRSISNFKQIYDTAVDFINTINVGDAKQMQTLACMIFDFLLNKTIPVWPKQEGWQSFPSRMKNQTMWKISISTYVLKLNIYRVMGYETLWLIIFGKLLSLLDFTWKRTQPIKRSSTAYKDLDLVKNGYFSLLKQDDMAPKYLTRLDLITYFLFCMTTFDPELVGQYLCQTAGQHPSTVEELKKHKYKWSYNYFWILVETILQNKTKTYFRPVIYMNMLSSMYLQIRRNKINSTEFQDFDHLRKYIIKDAIEYTACRALEQNEEIQALVDLEEQTRDFKFDGEDFLGQLETFNFYFMEKDSEYKKATDRKGLEEFQKRCSVFNYFKPDSK